MLVFISIITYAFYIILWEYVYFVFRYDGAHSAMW